VRWIVLLTIAAGCGRLGFDPRGGADADPVTGDGAHDGATDTAAGSDGATSTVTLAQSSPAIIGIGPQTVTLPNPTVAGSLLVATFGVNTMSLTLPAGWSTNATGQVTGACYSLIATNVTGAAGQQSFTFTLPGGAPVAVQISEWTGVDLGNPFDAAGFGGSMTPANPLMISTLGPTSVAGDLAIASFCEDTTNPTFTPGAGWTELGQGSNTSASPSMITEYQRGVAAGVVTASATSSLTTKYAATVLTFHAQ
jgi:hypothetical protein